MKKLLIGLFVAFVAFLNIRVLFCQHAMHDIKHLDAQVNTVDAVISIKHPYCCPLIEQDSHECLPATSAEYDLHTLMRDLKNSYVWNELGIQQLRNLLGREVTIVSFLQEGRSGKIRKALKKRNSLLRYSSPSIIMFYDEIMNIVCQDHTLELAPCCNEDGESVYREIYCSGKKRYDFLFSIKNRLLSIDTELVNAQYEMECR